MMQLQRVRTYSFLICLLPAMPFSVGEALAKKSNQAKASGAIDAKTFDVLMAVQELAEKEQYAPAIKRLNAIKHSDRLSSYAKSQMWNFYAFIYANQEKYPEAIGAYRKLLKETDAPEGLKQTAKYTLAQLYFQIEDYPSVIRFMEQWLREFDKPTATAHILLAQAYYESDKYDPALKNLVKAIKIEKSGGKPIRESWLRMKAAIHFEKRDIRNTLKTYEELLQHFPKLGYMKQIAALHGELGNERKRLTTYDAIYIKNGLSRESDVLNLAYMYLGQEVPYKAGRIIETGMRKKVIKASAKNTETLANTWAQANEHKKAIPALERAAKKSDKGVLYFRLAGVYFDAGEFEKAAEAARKANKKGGLKYRDGNQMLMGMAYFNIKEYEQALQAFRQAKRSKKSFADARKWEKYTLSELSRMRALQEGEIQLAERTQKVLAADANNIDALGGNILSE